MRQVRKTVIIQIVTIIMLICTFAAILRFTNTGTLILAIAEQRFTNSGVPSYEYINRVESNKSTGVGTFLINDIYPMNEYLMANEVYVEEYNDSQLAVDGEIIQVVEDDARMLQDGLDNDVTHDTTDDSTATGEVAAAITRNVVTGKTYSKAQLADYTFAKKFYTVTGITSLTKDIFRPAEFIEKDLSIKKDNSKPQILIFHTHSQETFVDSVAKDPATSIVGVGAYLAKLLTEKYGYNVIHDTSVYDLVDGKLDRSKAYTYAQEGIKKILDEHPSIEVVIDLHRDGVGENTHLVTEVEGKKVAKLMFFNGISYTNVNGNISYLNNPHRDDNLAMSLQMYLMGQAYYPGFLRNNYINAYRYCLHNRGRSMLVEAGAQTNTFEEVKNAMEPLADMLDKVLSGKKAY